MAGHPGLRLAVRRRNDRLFNTLIVVSVLLIAWLIVAEFVL